MGNLPAKLRDAFRTSRNLPATLREPFRSIGAGGKGAGASVMLNYLDNGQDQSEVGIKSFLSESGYSAGGDYIFRMQRSSSGHNPFSGNYSTGIGLTTPGIGVSYKYTPALFIGNPFK